MAKSRNGMYVELSKAGISPTRNIVISMYRNGGFTIAQQMETKENGRSKCVFMREAIHVDDVHSLYEVRDALNLAIEKAEAEAECKWDK